MKFLIKAIHSVAQHDGGSQIFGSGESPFVNVTEDLVAIPISKDKIKFVTGLSEQDIIGNNSLTDDEKKVFVKVSESAREKVINAFGADSVDPTNETFWSGHRATLRITNNTFSDVYDDENVEDLIFRMQIIGGGYASIAPTLEIAERTGKKFYLTGEDEFTEKNYEEEYGSKRKAIAALDTLLEQKGIDALLYLTWNTVDTNNGFTKNTSKQVFEKTLMEFIEGKHVKTGKKDCAKKFYDNYVEWKNNKDGVIGKAIIKAAYHFGELYMDDGKFKTTKRMTMLGSTLDESLKILMKPEHQNEFIDIKKVVEDKLNS
jgi:hypothetical protein